jgi:gamma-tubulin complex component 3
MGDSRGSRIDETLQALFESLVPLAHPEDNDTETEFRIERAIQSAKDTAHAGHARLPAEVNQAQDLIKRKLLRENSSPEKAARFSNLYSRLLAIPVLNQKWAILYLLLKLSDHSIPDPPERQPLVESEHFSNPQRHRDQAQSRPATSESEGVHAPLQKERPRELQRPNIAPSKKAAADTPPSSAGKDAASQPMARPPPGPSEQDLLQDLPFNLQGLSSKHLHFSSASSIQLPTTLPVPILSILYTLSEPCLLYKELATFSQAHGGSLITQSLRAAISQELRSYLGLVATLEGEIRRAVAALEHGEDAKSVRMTGVTLKRCVIWTRDATMGLRLMSLFVEEASQKKGGQIISLIYDLSSSHGDPFVGAFAERLLAQVARPFYEMLRHWIYDGELVDPYHEFFVTEPDPNSKPDIDPRRVATSIWEDKYKLDPTLVPSIISSDFAKKIFLIGKSLNFIRHNCGDSDWVVQYSKTNSKSLDYANTATLSSSIDTAYASTMSRLTFLMSSRFGLFTHLDAMKKYIFLSQGDFMDLLMESLAPYLDRPADSQYRHTLTSQLEHAIRHSNAQYDDPEVLRRLDARMLEISVGETGWDCFTLEYKVSPPCDVIITTWANMQYLKVFNMLLRIKRVEFSLNTSWRRCATGSRSVLGAVSDKLGKDWQRARCVMAEMVHFINQLQYYLLFEVIESNWKELQTAMRRPDASLDDLIEAHTKYLNNITKKGLLGEQKHSHIEFTTQLHNILKCMLAYRDAVDGLYSFSVAEFTKRQQFSAKIEQRTAQGKWGITEKDLAGDSRSSTPLPGMGGRGDSTDSPLLPPLAGLKLGDDQSLLESLRSRLLHLSAEFRSRVNILLYDLAHQPDTDLRFLGVVMNFNEVYKPVNVRRQQRKEREKREMERQSREVSGATTAGEERNAGDAKGPNG